MPAFQCDHAGAHQFEDSKLPKEILDGFSLALIANDSKGQRRHGDVDDGGAEDVGNLNHFVARFARGGADLNQHKLTADCVFGVERLDGVNANQLPQLGRNEVRLLFAGEDFDGDAGDSGIVGRADGEGLDVVALAGEKAHYAGKDARLVIHQNGEGFACRGVHGAASFRQLSINSVM